MSNVSRPMSNVKCTWCDYRVTKSPQNFTDLVARSLHQVHYTFDMGQLTFDIPRFVHAFTLSQTATIRVTWFRPNFE
jgi:hypothetical protein